MQKTNYNQKVFHPLAITIVLMVIFVFGNAFGVNSISSALESTPTDATQQPPMPVQGNINDVNAQTSADCQTKLTAFADPEFVKLTEFMEKNFSNKSNTTSLLDVAMKRYVQFKTDIRAQLQLALGGQISLANVSASSNAAQLPGVSACEGLAQTYIDNAAKLVQMRAFTTSGIKKASIFVEKYRQLNTKLRELDLGIMKIVVNLSSFQEKLPCYVKTCV